MVQELLPTAHQTPQHHPTALHSVNHRTKLTASFALEMSVEAQSQCKDSKILSPVIIDSVQTPVAKCRCIFCVCACVCEYLGLHNSHSLRQKSYTGFSNTYINLELLHGIIWLCWRCFRLTPLWQHSFFFIYSSWFTQFIMWTVKSANRLSYET